MSANSTTKQSAQNGREKMIAIAREIRGEFAKIHSLMGQALTQVKAKKAA